MIYTITVLFSIISFNFLFGQEDYLFSQKSKYDSNGLINLVENYSRNSRGDTIKIVQLFTNESLVREFNYCYKGDELVYYTTHVNGSIIDSTFYKYDHNTIEVLFWERNKVFDNRGDSVVLYLSSKTIKNYNESGKVLRDSIFTYDSKTKLKKVNLNIFSYDDNKLVEQKYSANQQSQSLVKFIYDGNELVEKRRLLITITENNSDTTATSTIKYQYLLNNRKRIESHSLGSLSFKFVKVINRSGKIKKEIFINEPSNEINRKTIYRYKNDKLVKVKQWSQATRKWIVIEEYKYL